jgi:hypothetical protein
LASDQISVIVERHLNALPLDLFHVDIFVGDIRDHAATTALSFHADASACVRRITHTQS